MKKLAFPLLILLTVFNAGAQDPLPVKPTRDFTIDGKGSHEAWNQAAWVELKQLDEGVTGYTSRFKILYSTKGIYVLFHGIDQKVTSTYYHDFDDMYNADVFEAFFHPEPRTPIYFEYEINAHDKELVLLIPNLDHKIMGWIPWHYEGDRKVQHKVYIESGADGMKSWSAECFFPFSLLSPLQSVPPVKGTLWKANFCRLDYDAGKMIKWAWSPVKVSFHEYEVYRSIRFE